jgi:hypothetical protein
MTNTFESMISTLVRDAVREAVTEELRKLPSLLPAAASDAGWFEEEEFRRRFGLKSRDGLMAAVKAGTVERKALSPCAGCGSRRRRRGRSEGAYEWQSMR